VRETLEETGLSIVNPRLEWVENSFFGLPDDLQHYVTIFMRADLEDQVPPPPRVPLRHSPSPLNTCHQSPPEVPAIAHPIWKNLHFHRSGRGVW